VEDLKASVPDHPTWKILSQWKLLMRWRHQVRPVEYSVGFVVVAMAVVERRVNLLMPLMSLEFLHSAEVP